MWKVIPAAGSWGWGGGKKIMMWFKGAQEEKHKSGDDLVCRWIHFYFCSDAEAEPHPELWALWWLAWLLPCLVQVSGTCRYHTSSGNHICFNSLHKCKGKQEFTINMSSSSSSRTMGFSPIQYSVPRCQYLGHRLLTLFLFSLFLQLWK